MRPSPVGVSGRPSAVIASVCAASASASLTTHLVAHYALDGNACDTGPFANHGVVYEAGVTADRFGREGRALTFDGFNDSVRIADSESLNLTGDFTISAQAGAGQATGFAAYPLTDPPTSADGYSRLRITPTGQTQFYRLRQ